MGERWEPNADDLESMRWGRLVESDPRLARLRAIRGQLGAFGSMAAQTTRLWRMYAEELRLYAIEVGQQTGEPGAGLWLASFADAVEVAASKLDSAAGFAEGAFGG